MLSFVRILRCLVKYDVIETILQQICLKLAKAFTNYKNRLYFYIIPSHTGLCTCHQVFRPYKTDIKINIFSASSKFLIVDLHTTWTKVLNQNHELSAREYCCFASLHVLLRVNNNLKPFFIRKTQIYFASFLSLASQSLYTKKINFLLIASPVPITQKIHLWINIWNSSALVILTTP